MNISKKLLAPTPEDIRVLRAKYNLSVSLVTKLLYIHRMTFYAYEAGTRPMPIALYELLNYKLKDPELQDFIFGYDNPSNIGDEHDDTPETDEATETSE